MELLRFIGPGILVTVGFIDPGNWAANLSAGAGYGYQLLWMVTLSTIWLIILQHNVAHLGIVTGDCLAEAAHRHLPGWLSRPLLYSAVAAAIATAMAEITGMAIALNMLFHLPIMAGSALAAIVSFLLLAFSSYNRIERLIVGFVSLIGLAFLYELVLVPADWPAAVSGWLVPALPEGSIVIVMSVLGAVVMPHNLYLHSEVIQSRQWNLGDEATIRRQLRYEFIDTLLSMGIGWAINSAMIVVAAAVFFASSVAVDDLRQAAELLRPLLNEQAALVFALALLFAGISSTITAGMAGGSIFAGSLGEAWNGRDIHSRAGMVITYGGALLVCFLAGDSLKALVYSQMALSLQLPLTIFLQLYLTSSRRVMGKYANSRATLLMMLAIGLVITGLNVFLLIDLFS
ncbi:MAG: Nramp family divalent metal transporter [Negativicutes bacterium]|nr:Nramp family divalent metal transporter [Negativicutes bacterium]